MTAYHVPARALALATFACATPALAGCTSPDAQKSPGAEANAGPKMNPQNSSANWSFRQTGEVTRFEVHAGDRWHGDGTQPKERSEAYASGKLSLTQPNDVRFDMMIEQGPRITAQWLTLVQLQSTFDPGEAGHSPPFAIAILESGAIVAVNLSETETVKPTSTDAVIKVEGNMTVQTLAGATQSAGGFSTTYSDQLFFYVPGPNSTEKIRLLGYASDILKAQVIS